jgi:hypothetical protein
VFSVFSFSSFSSLSISLSSLPPHYLPRLEHCGTGEETGLYAEVDAVVEAIEVHGVHNVSAILMKDKDSGKKRKCDMQLESDKNPSSERFKRQLCGVTAEYDHTLCFLRCYTIYIISWCWEITLNRSSYPMRDHSNSSSPSAVFCIQRLPLPRSSNNRPNYEPC